MIFELDFNRKFDLLQFIETKATVKYWTSGKNVSPGWITFRCFYCDDNSNHLGIKIATGDTYCWKCGKHNFHKTIMRLTKCTFQEASSIKFTKKHKTPKKTINYDEITKNIITLPEGITEIWPASFLKYLKKRKFKPKKIIRKYQLKATYPLGKYKFRIVIPIIMNRKIKSFICRDITGRREPKYLMPEQFETIKTPKQCIYNYDSVQNGGNCILVEGPTDVWRMGKGAISFFGVTSSTEQLVHFKRKNINKLFIMMDNDAPGKTSAKKISNFLSPLAKSTEIITMTSHPDPGSLLQEEAEIIKKELGFF